MLMEKGNFINEDFAIIGMSCRFPKSNHYQEFWQNLAQAKKCTTEIPEDRWDWKKFYGDPQAMSNKTNVCWGGFIDDIDKFDPGFFNISPKEAAFIDPQHRLFLQAAWHAVEDAGYSVDSLSGKKVGVYAGVSKNDYAEKMRECELDIAPFVSTGTVHSILANRVSFLFNLRGRSEVIDTACSSGSVVLHNAMRDINNGECEAAIVGGVNAILTPTMHLSHSKSGMLSPDGECHTFDANANGYVRAEGVGVLVIKPLTNAILEGDNIHAIIKGSAVNHGGRSSFLTSPSVDAQTEVITMALENADIDPATVSYIEAHGSGTPLGDPIEVEALKRAYGVGQYSSVKGKSVRQKSEHCALSSVKTNIGHLESASGIAGIIKVVLAMQNESIPALRTFKKINPAIDLAGSPFYLVDKFTNWNRLKYEDGTEVPRRAGVSSFGMGGVNTHVILEEAPHRPSKVESNRIQKPQLILISSKSEKIIHQLESMRKYLLSTSRDGMDSDELLRNLAYTLQIGRNQFSNRLALVVNSMNELFIKLSAYIEGNTSQGDFYIGREVIKNGQLPIVLKPTHDMSLNDLAEKWVSGTTFDWSAYYESTDKPLRISAPTYVFDNRRCWFSKGSNGENSRSSSNSKAAKDKEGINAPQNHNFELKSESFFMICCHLLLLLQMIRLTRSIDGLVILMDFSLMYLMFIVILLGVKSL